MCNIEYFEVIVVSEPNSNKKVYRLVPVFSQIKIWQIKKILHIKKIFFERSGGGNCEAIFDGAERVLKFSILYTHYICGGVNKFLFCILGVTSRKSDINYIPTENM
jgi:hypothetical protein